MNQLSKRVLIFVFFIVQVKTVFSQVNVDSLKTVSVESENDTIKLNVFYRLAMHYKVNDVDSANYFANQITKLKKVSDSYKLGFYEQAKGYIEQQHNNLDAALANYKSSYDYFSKENHTKNMAEATNNRGVVFYYQGHYDSATVYFSQAAELNLLINDSIGAAQAYNNSGIMMDIKGDMTKAVQYYMDALRIYENHEKNVDHLIMVLLINLGTIHLNMEKYDEGQVYFTKSLEIAKSLSKKYEQTISLNSIGIIYDKKNELDSAQYFYKKALDLSLEIDNSFMLAKAYTNLGANALLRSEVDQGIEFFLKSIEEKDKAKSDAASKAQSYVGLGDAYLQAEKLNLASKNYMKALDLLELSPYKKYISGAQFGLAKTHYKLRNYKTAYDHLFVYMNIKDTLLNESNAKIIEELKTAYETEKKEAEIKLLTKNSEIKELALEKSEIENNKNKMLLYMSLSVGIILLVFLFYAIKASRERKKTNKILSKQNHEIKEKNKEILDSITYAKRLQDAILPAKKVVKSFLIESFIIYRPKDIVAGDFYYMDVIEENLSADKHDGKKYIYYVAADCTGHGVPGAMVSIVGANGLKRCIQEFELRDPGKILDKLAELVTSNFSQSEEQIRDGMDLALCCLEMENDKTVKIHYAGANNPLWVVNPNRKVIPENSIPFKQGGGFEIKANKQAIGYTENITPFDSHTIDVEEGDTLYTFSDGYSDQFGGSDSNRGGKKYKSANFKNLLLSIYDKNMDEQKEFINKEFDKWKGDLEQLDDVCVIGVRL